MAHPLDGIWEKIKRADEHIKNLDLDITSFLQSDIYKIVGYPQSETREHVLRVMGPPPPLRFSVIAGEVIHQCRSALDHLIWQLVLANQGTPDRRHEFPICETTGKFKEACDRRKIKGISSIAARIIESIQPYNNPKGFEWHPLWVLHSMDITDKHKLLMVVIATASLSGQMLSIDPGQSNVNILGFSEPKWPSRPTEDGTEIFRIRLGEPAPQMNVDVKPAIQVAFEEYGPLREQPVLHCIKQLRDVTVGMILKFTGELKRHTS